MCDDPIGVFDSGVGGLNVLRRCVMRLPNEKFIYLADKANMPYGARQFDFIKTAALECAETLVSMNCKAIAVACNTATVAAVDEIRKLYGSVIVVGLEPAVKPCFRALKSGYAVALITEATNSSPKFGRLLSDCGDKIKAVAQPRLAKLIEDNCDNIDEIAPYVCSVLEPYRDASAVVLGCSHYTYITRIISEFYGGKIDIYDGADGEAAQLRSRLESAGALAPPSAVGSVRFYSTYKKA